jgi:putative Mg2+ transporter-C (MgtC) family protein
MLSETMRHYWSGDILAANVFIGLNLLGALLLGMLVGYERSYQGRAAAIVREKLAHYDLLS